MKQQWKYATKTEDEIRSALVRILGKKQLADVTVAELAREASISRSTFYEHFNNPVDVYDGIVAEFSQGLSPIMEQVACTSELKTNTEPFCARLRDNACLGHAIDEDRFLSTLLNQTELLEKHDLFTLLTEAGYTPHQARSLCAFQLAGCFTASRMTAPAQGDTWVEVKSTIDRFILGGIAACLAAKR